MHFNLKKNDRIPLVIGSKSSNEEKELQLSSAFVPASESITDLGLRIEDHLKWGCHVKINN